MENQLECPHCGGLRVTTSFLFLTSRNGGQYISQYTYLLYKLAFILSIGFMTIVGFMALSGRFPNTWVLFIVSVILFFIAFAFKGNAERSRIRLTHKCKFCGHVWTTELDSNLRAVSPVWSGD